jgi:hypothetical protein
MVPQRDAPVPSSHRSRSSSPSRRRSCRRWRPRRRCRGSVRTPEKAVNAAPTMTTPPVVAAIRSVRKRLSGDRTKSQPREHRCNARLPERVKWRSMKVSTRSRRLDTYRRGFRARPCGQALAPWPRSVVLQDPVARRPARAGSSNCAPSSSDTERRYQAPVNLPKRGNPLPPAPRRARAVPQSAAAPFRPRRWRRGSSARSNRRGGRCGRSGHATDRARRRARR